MAPSDLPAGPISPELVLVDPELAAKARAALPERPWPAVPRIPAVTRAELPPRRGLGSFVGGFLALGLAAALLVGLSVLPTPDRPTFAAGPGDVTDRSPQPRAATRPRLPTTSQEVTEPPAQRSRAERQTPKAKAPARRPRAKPSTPQSRAPATRRRAKPSTPSTQSPRPARRPAAKRSTPQIPRRSTVRLTVAPSFAWAPHEGARYYIATFLRDGKVFYRAQSRLPRLRLPARIRLRAGEYRWIVRPAIDSDAGIRLGDPIVDSTFQVGGD